MNGASPARELAELLHKHTGRVLAAVGTTDELDRAYDAAAVAAGDIRRLHDRLRDRIAARPLPGQLAHPLLEPVPPDLPTFELDYLERRIREATPELLARTGRVAA